MLERQHGSFIIECDTCGESDEDDPGDGAKYEFDAFWLAKKQEGWQARRIGVDWTHKCPKCASKE